MHTIYYFRKNKTLVPKDLADNSHIRADNDTSGILVKCCYSVGQKQGKN